MLKGWKTYLAAFAAIGLGALDAIPSDWKGDDVAEILGVVFLVLRAVTSGPAGVSMASLRTKIPVYRTYALPLLFAIGTAMFLSAPLSGCVNTLRQLGVETGDCQLMDYGTAFATPLLQPKCDRAPNPATDDACLTLSGMTLATQLCYVGVRTSDDATLAKAKADYAKAKAKAPVPIEPPPMPVLTPDVSPAP